MKKIIIIFVFCFVMIFAKAEFPPHVWIYWNDATTIPEFYQRCLESSRRALKDTRWEIKLLTDSNITLFLTTEEFDLEMYKKHVVYMQFLSDLFRYKILQKYGGVYIDISGFLV